MQDYQDDRMISKTVWQDWGLDCQNDRMVFSLIRLILRVVWQDAGRLGLFYITVRNGWS
jgi:hypothetical protein